MGGRKKILRLAAGIVVLFVLNYLAPLAGSKGTWAFGSALKDQDGLYHAWSLSLLLSTASSLLNVGLGLLAAIYLKNIKIGSSLGNLLALLLLPVILGNVSIAFVGRVLFTDAALVQHNAAGKLLTFLLIQFWQYGTVYTYLFWLLIRSVPAATAKYAAVVRMSAGEYAKHVLLPACRNLTLLLFLINFAFTFYEDAKIQLIFRTSEGTGTELISQWLSRHYLSYSLIDQSFAVQQTVSISVAVAFSAVVMVSILILLGHFAYQQLLTYGRRLRLFLEPGKAGKLLVYTLVLFILLPLLPPFISAFKNFGNESATLLFPFLLTFLAALITCTLGAILAFLIRVGWQQRMQRFDGRSLIFFLAQFLIGFIPPLVLLLCGYQWLKVLGYDNPYKIYIVWVAGHSLLGLPLIATFLTVTHFRTVNVELDYMTAHRVKLPKLFQTLFLQRFKADYLLAFLIAFSLIWNESIINNILSDYVPSFVSNLKMTIEGRAVDFSKGVSFLIVSLGVAFLALTTWFTILKKISGNEAFDQH